MLGAFGASRRRGSARYGCAFILMVYLILGRETAFAQDDSAALGADADEGLSDDPFGGDPFAGDSAEAEARFSYRVRTLVNAGFIKPAQGVLDPNNAQLNLPADFGSLELRSDFMINTEHWELAAKPRLNTSFSYQIHPEADHDGSLEAFVRYAWIRYIPFDALSFSFGSENLQWGPSLLFSPSNPFFEDNFRLNPQQEGPGSYFARIVWTMTSSLSLSLIANVYEGEKEQRTEFKRRYAIKLDYLGSELQITGLASYVYPDVYELGAYAMWTASDGLLVYGEAAFEGDSTALYPVAEENGIGFSLKPRANDEALILLAGVAYTFDFGLTLTTEYIHATSGYTDGEAERLHDLRVGASRARARGDASAPLATLLTLQSIAPAGRFLRKNYSLLQLRYVWGDDADAEAGVWWTQNIDDGSASVVPLVLVPASDRVSIFGLTMVNVGPAKGEYRSIVSYQGLIGFDISLL